MAAPTSAAPIARGAGAPGTRTASAPGVYTRFVRRLASFLVLVVIASSGGGCTRRTAVRPNAALRPGALRGANILLVTIDTLRADRVGAYGGGALTPTLDRIAQRGVRLTNAHAHAPLTLPAHASMLTGLIPVHHGVRDNGGVLGPHAPTLAEGLRRAGYRTGAFVGAFVLDRRFGLDRGFDVYDDRMGVATGPIDFAVPRRTGDRVVAAAADWIVAGGSGTARGSTAQPSNAASPAPNPQAPGPQLWFCWVHLFDAHAPYRHTEGRATSAYDSGVAYADDQIGVLVERLRAAGQLDNTLIVALADHGEALGDHGEATHGLFAYESTLHIPFVLAGPSIAPDVVAAAAAEADVAPTILELVGAPAIASTDGRSLVPALRGDGAADAPTYFEALDAYLTRNWAPLTGIVADGWKYVDLPEPELYDLRTDPGETHNMAGAELQRRQTLARELEARQALASPREAVPALDPDAAARLRALGYASPQAAPARRSFGVADDPKRLLDIHRRYEQALTLTGDRQYRQAIALLQSVIEARPDFVLAYTNLAAVLIQTGHAADAAALLERAARSGLRTPELEERLGAAYLASGQPARAVTVLTPLAARDHASIDALNTLGVALAQSRHLDEARRLFARVLERSPTSVTTWNNLGLLELNQGRSAEASRAFERAVTIDPGFADGWKALGTARARSDRNGSIDAWRHAVELRPDDYDALYNVIVMLEQEQRRDDARPYLDRFIREAPPARYAAEIANLQRWRGSR